jgi:hypothetical protein
VVRVFRQCAIFTLCASNFLLDLMWSDSDDIDNLATSPRGAEWSFGGSVAGEVCHRRR